MLTFGLIINPYAGIGGSVGLKGSDGIDIVQEALSRGGQQKAMSRTHTALAVIQAYHDQCRFLTCPGDMGASVLDELGFDYQIIGSPVPMSHTSAEHTRIAARDMAMQGVDILLFAGGDGTARDVYAALEKINRQEIPALGIPAGVKIHSGVYGISPNASGEVLKALLNGALVDIKDAEVRDLDEQAFRHNHVRAKHYGDLRVPQSGHFVQAVKQGGIEVEELVLDDIADEIRERMRDDTLYLMGSGKTIQAVMQNLGVNNTLLGVDAIYQGKLLQADINEQDILMLMQQYPGCCAVLSVMGGQGHIIGRGNQQFSATVLKHLGKNNIILVSTKSKIQALQGRPLLIDSGDRTLDEQWAGSIEVITGYHDRIIQPLSC